MTSTINPFHLLLGKLAAGTKLTKSEATKIGKIGRSRLKDYAEAWEILSDVFPTRMDRMRAAEQVAERLGITFSGINKTIRPDFKRPELQRDLVQDQVETVEQKILLTKAAISVIGAGERPEDLVSYCGSSTRTIYRHVSRLLKPSGLTLQDVNEIAFHHLRTQLAAEIEAKALPPLLAKLEKRKQNAAITQELRKRT